MRLLNVIFISALSLFLASCATDGPIPEGFKSVTETGRQFTFAIPQGWKRDARNSYKFGLDTVFYEVHPVNPGTVGNCLPPFNSPGRSEKFQFILIDIHPYDNGLINGCQYIVDYLNLENNVVWRHTTFQFIVNRQQVSFVVVAPKESFDAKESYDENFTKTIIDSIAINHGL